MKRWYDYPKEIEALVGKKLEVYRCEFCQTIYKPNRGEMPQSYTLRNYGPHGAKIPQSELIHDWNTFTGAEIPTGRRVLLDDETLRDGLQNPSVHDPCIAEKIEILHLMEALGIDTVNIGLPGAGPAPMRTPKRSPAKLCARMKIRPNCAARTHKTDIQPIIEISETRGHAARSRHVSRLEPDSPPRRRLDRRSSPAHHRRCREICGVRRTSRDVRHRRHDSHRSLDGHHAVFHGDSRGRARHRALRHGGHATPRGAYNLVKFAIDEVVKPSGEKIRVDWHGHNDRGLAVANSLAAIAAGADQVHAAALALGERVGNTPMELMLVNLRLLGLIDRDLSHLKKYSDTVAKATRTPIPPNYPVVGRDAFRTATGVHAAAIVKAYKKGDEELANSIYSGVPSHHFGLEQIIEIGPMSGRSNVTYWLEKRGVAATDELVDRIFDAAKKSERIFTEDEIIALIGSAMAAGKSRTN